MKNKRIIIIDEDNLTAAGLAARLNAWGADSRTIDTTTDMDAILKELWLSPPDYILVGLNDNPDSHNHILYSIKSDTELYSIPTFSYTQSAQEITPHPSIDKHISHNNIISNRFLSKLEKIIRHWEISAA